MRPLAIASLAMVIIVSAAAEGLPPSVGQPAPDFSLKDQSGKTVGLSSLRGRKVVLIFYRGYW